MKFKFTLLILLLYALSSCGYAPIYSTKGVNFNIQKIEIFKKDRLNKTFKNKIKNYSHSKSDDIISLKINSKKKRQISSKDARGNPKIFNMTISVELEVLKAGSIMRNKKFTKNFSYENSSKKFELRQYENNIQNNLVDEITDNILLYLQSL